MLNVTVDSLRACTSSSRDLIYDLTSEFVELISAIRTVRGDEVAEAFLLMIHNMDEAGAFFAAAKGGSEHVSDGG